MKFPVTTFNIFYFELNGVAQVLTHSMSLDARQTWGSWETTSSLGKTKTKKQGGDKSYYLSSVFVLHIGGKNQQLT